ncbi:MAG: hypothetical protein C9356_11700 [Oleiphilus sp.]|nr:MAG: hypothetical protein C9356_11700 [Oleiphilus sp.]
MRDLEARKQCLDISKSILVRASAGCGKTHESVNRVLSLLGSACDQPEEILAITFTVDAAEELRARVIDAIRRVQGGMDAFAAHEQTTYLLAEKVAQRDRKLGWQLLTQPDRLKVMTFDAFYQLIVKQVGNDVLGGDYLQITERPEFLYDDAIDSVLADAWSDEFPWCEAVRQLWEVFDGVESRIRALLVDMLRTRDQWGEAIVSFQSRGDFEVVQKLLGSQCMAHIPDEVIHRAKTLLGQLDDIGSLDHPVLQSFSKRPGVEGDVAEYAAFSRWLLTCNKTFKRKATVREGFPPSKDKSNADLVSELKQDYLALGEAIGNGVGLQALALLGMLGEDEDPLLETMVTVLNALLLQLKATMDKQRECDFTEIALRANTVLGREDAPSELLLKLDYQIRHILVDEAQDTSNLQLRTLELLTAGWQPDDGRTLFVVGDGKQSIYRFRKANAGIFDYLERNGINMVKFLPLELNTNFRSTSSVVSWIDDQFEQIFPSASLGCYNGFAHRRSYAVREAEDSGVQLPLIEGENDTECRAKEAGFICEEIGRIRTNTPHASIAILGKSRAAFAQVIDQMNRQEIDFRGLDMDPLNQCLDVLWLMALCNVVVNPESVEDWVAVLHSPYMGWKMGEVEALVSRAKLSGSIESAFTQDQRGDHKVRLVLWATRQRYRTYTSKVVRAVWRELGGVAIASHHRAMSKTEKVFEIIDALERKGELFAEQLQERIDASFGNRDAQRDNPVLCMTIHKSKGLEFDYVFVIGAGDGGRHDDLPLVRMDAFHESGMWGMCIATKCPRGEHSRQYQLLGEIEKQRQRLELQRLLYVALTRARNGLYLLGHCVAGGLVCKPNSLLSASVGVLEDLFEAIEQAAPPVCSTGGTGQLIAHFQAETADGGLQLARTNDLSVDELNVLQPLDERLFGELAHKLLERFERSDFDRSFDWMGQVPALARWHGLGHQLDRVVPRCRAIVDWMLKSTLFDGTSDHDSECSITGKLGGKIVTKRLDYYAVRDNRCIVVDYKFPSQEQSDDQLLGAYQKTMQDYATLMVTKGFSEVQCVIVQPEFGRTSIVCGNEQLEALG